MQAADRGRYAASESCPDTWPVLQPGPPSAGSDGNVSVLVGGSFTATGAANGAEGVVVVRGSAGFAREGGGSYEVGSVSYGSQIAPVAGSDMLTVGGVLDVAPGTRLEVGARLGGDVVVGDVTATSDYNLYGGRLDPNFPGAVAPYEGLLGELAGRSAAYAGLTPTGPVEVSDDKVVLHGDGVSEVQVFTVDGSTLNGPSLDAEEVDDDQVDPPAAEGSFAAADADADSGSFAADGGAGGADGGEGEDGEGGDEPSQEPPPPVSGRALQVVGVPKDATVVVNLLGPTAEFDVDGLREADGSPMDPTSSPSFAELSTHLIWNVPTATAVDIGGEGQLPGSLLVADPASKTVLSGAGTNGRVLVAGDLVHSGAGRLHSYPLVTDPALGCGPELAHEGSLRLDVRLQDADGVVDAAARFFQGDFECTLDGAVVTPKDAGWQQRASGDRVLSTTIPIGSVCSVSEKLDVPPKEGYVWADPVFEPSQVVVAKRRPQTIVLTNRAKALPTPPSSPQPTSEPPSPTSSPAPSSQPTPQAPVDPPTTVEPTEGPGTSMPDPTGRPEPTEAAPEPSSEPSAAAPDDEEGATSDGRRARNDAAPAITAPFTLQGAFVWGPLLLLSLLTLLFRFRGPQFPRIPKPPRMP